MSRLFPLLFGLGLGAAALAADKPAGDKRAPAPVATPLTLAGAETFIYHDVQPEPMRLHVFKPEGWAASDKRPAWLHFFGGGFVNGTPLQSAGQGRNAAKLGLVGVAVDYRVKNRHGTDASACVADARAALRWVEEHAAELGVDPKRIVVSGSSAGGHLALWTAITQSPWGSNPAEAPRYKPAALILLSAAADTSEVTGQRAERFAGHGSDLSATQNLDAKMPPVLMFHGDADTTVPYKYAVELHETLVQWGNDCTFITIPRGGHNLTATPGVRERIVAESQAFLERLKILSVGN